MKRDAQDREFSKMIRERDDFTCQRCGSVHAPNSQGLHSAHMFSRGKLSTRFDPENACALCYGCHRHLDQNPGQKATFWISRIGILRFVFDGTEGGRWPFIVDSVVIGPDGDALVELRADGWWCLADRWVQVGTPTDRGRTLR